MKQFLFFLLCTFLIIISNAQSSYSEAMQQGDEAFNKGQYKTAIDKYLAAEAFDPSKKEIVKERVSKVFEKIETLRKEAESATKKALIEKKRAEDAKLEQVLQTEIAIREKEKLQELNEYMKYSNRQLFNVIQTDKLDLLDLKLREYNLLTKYQDSLINNNYRFYSLNSISEYYEYNNKLEDALGWADSLCQEYPDSALSFLRRSIVNYYIGNWEEALSDVNKSLKLNPDVYMIRGVKLNEALILCNLGRYEDSRKSLNEAIILLRKMPKEEIEIYEDYFVSKEIVDSTSINSIFMDRDYQIKALEIYTTINDVYAGIAPIQKLVNMNKEKLPLNILLTIINYTTIHMQALPNDYIGYLVIGYFWEMAYYPDLSERNYTLFLEKNKKLQTIMYNRYKNMFNSPIYNKLKN